MSKVRVKPIKIADLEAYISGDGRDIEDLKSKDFDMVLVHVKRIPVILVRADFPEKEAIIAAALEGVLKESRGSRQYPEARNR